MDTIFALASARGRAGVAVIRLSGPRATVAGAALCGTLPPPRRAGLRVLRWQGEVLDEALVLVFEAGGSFTGEPVVELQTHGSPAVVSAVLGALAAQDGLRLAEAGEFTRRALANGRMDLAQVEGLADLLAAETEAQRRQAQRLLAGALGERAEGWRRRLLRAAALLEATIDFVDEEVPTHVAGEVAEVVSSVAEEVRQESRGVGAAERVRDGFEVALVGRPNAGKSTLLNALAGREAALTDAEPGTTRDVIEVRMDLGGLAVTFLDTAGLREAEGVEGQGVARGRARAEAADLRIFLVAPGELAEDLAPRPDDLVVIGKADLHPGVVQGVSGLTGAGVSELVARVGDVLGRRAAGAGTATRLRHRLALDRAETALGRVVEWVDDPSRSDLAAEELRTAMRALEALVGRVDVEHILDEVFSSFCIGK